MSLAATPIRLDLDRVPRVDQVGVEERVARLPVAVDAFALADRALVPGEAQPSELREDPPLRARVIAGAVGVVDPQDELPAALRPQRVVEERGVGGADVGVTGR